MRRDPDGPHDVGLVVAVVIGDDREYRVGLQAGKARYSASPAEARDYAEAILTAVSLIESGHAGRLPSVAGAATAGEVAAFLRREL